jgi:Uma2 family endonuclease
VNPCFLIEVLSPSTESYDRGDKLLHYKQIPSLEAVLLVAHDEQRLELWRRTNDRWTLELARATERLTVPSLGVTLDVAEVYRNPLR